MASGVWDSERLCRFVAERLRDRLLLVVSNREPYVHSFSGDEVVWERPVGGLTEALDPVMRASGGIWVAQGTGDADHRVVDGQGRVGVPPDNPQYTLRRVWLSSEDADRFYLGFSNEALWPLCHITFTPPIYREEDWQAYRRVNGIFAGEISREIAGRPAVVLVQDYHFALLPRLLKERHPRMTVGQFWHIPWPAYEVFRTCPWGEEILEGMLGNDLLGFHIPSFCDNFLQTAQSALGAEIDRESGTVWHRGKTTVVAPFPISVDFEGLSRQASGAEVAQEMEHLRREYRLEGRYLGISIDRMDYTKGIPQRLQALERFFQDFPEYCGRVVFIQMGMLSRSRIESYQHTMRQIEELIGSINSRYGTADWQPVIALTRQLSRTTLDALRRLASFCVVSSLHDGMNLVAKEFVASRADGDGVLILSRFAGAAEELPQALLINPYATADFAGEIRRAIEMPPAERRRRMRAMRAAVAEGNIFRWGAALVGRLLAVTGG